MERVEMANRKSRHLKKRKVRKTRKQSGGQPSKQSGFVGRLHKIINESREASTTGAAGAGAGANTMSKPFVVEQDMIVSNKGKKNSIEIVSCPRFCIDNKMHKFGETSFEIKVKNSTEPHFAYVCDKCNCLKIRKGGKNYRHLSEQNEYEDEKEKEKWEERQWLGSLAKNYFQGT